MLKDIQSAGPMDVQTMRLRNGLAEDPRTESLAFSQKYEEHDSREESAYMCKPGYILRGGSAREAWKPIKEL